MTIEPAEITKGATAATIEDRLEAGGPLFIKLGHFLGSRPDLVEDAYIDLLLTLPDRAPTPVPWDAVRALLIQAWGSGPEDKLGSIATEPTTSRILDQSHAATLADGTPATVRFIRPEARALADEIAIQRRGLQQTIELCCPRLQDATASVIGDFRAWLADQINLAAELRHRSAAPAREEVAGGSPVPSLCTADILVTQGRPAPALTQGSVGTDGGKTVIHLLFAQIFVRCSTQDMPTAANIGVGADGKAEWIGRGPYRPLSAIERQDVRALWAGLHAHDEGEVLRAVRRSLKDADTRAFEQLERSILSAMRRNVATSGSAGKIPGRREAHGVDDVLLGILRAVRRSGLSMAPGPLRAHRMFVAGYRIARWADAASDPEDAGRERLTQLDVRDALATLEPDQLRKIAVDLLLLLRHAPERLNQIAADLADGSLGITLTLDETSKAAEAWNRRVRILATAIASLGPFFLLGHVGTARMWGIPLYVGLGLVLVLLYGFMLLQWRNLK